VAIRVFIQYETVPGNESSPYQLLMENRTRLLRIEGYMSGKTLQALDDPSSFLIISTRNSLDEWPAWVNSNKRKEIQTKCKPLLRTPPAGLPVRLVADAVPHHLQGVLHHHEGPGIRLLDLLFEPR
jgi:heme-degrading monooxygenase HmoA